MPAAKKKRRAARKAEIKAAALSVSGKSDFQAPGHMDVPGDWDPSKRRLMGGQPRGAKSTKDKADKRKTILKKNCADRCVQFPHHDLDDIAKDLWHEYTGPYARFQDAEGNDIDFPYKSIKSVKEIIRSTFKDTKAALKNQKK